MTNRTVSWSDVALDVDPRRALTPAAWSAFAAFGVAVWTVAPRHLLALSRARMAQLLCVTDPVGADLMDTDNDVPVEQLADLKAWPTSPAFDATERAALTFTEQFIIDVSGVSEGQRAAVAECLPPEQLHPFVLGLYFCDFDLRHTMVLTRLFEGAHLVRTPVPPSVVASSVPAAPDAGERLNEMKRTIALMDGIDPVTTELVRLKCARTHNCRVCQSTRSVAAISQGADETTFEKVDRFEESDLSERQRTALRLAQAMVTQPSSLSADTLDEIRRLFSPVEALELVYDVVRTGVQKVAVAMDLDTPRVEQGHDYFDLDDRGDIRIGVPAPLEVG